MITRTGSRNIIALVAILSGLFCSQAYAGVEIYIDVGRGDVPVFVPSGYDPEVPTPLVMLLHGYGSSGAEQEGYMRFKRIADEYNYIFTYPDGTVDLFGNRFWNAMPACCDFYGTGIDDSGYLLEIIDEISRIGNIDEKRVYIVGHSNGGFMAHRMACDHAPLIAAIASLAGSSYNNFDNCSPSEPIHTLRIHGTEDESIYYDGSEIPIFGYPGAIELSFQWLVFNECDRHVDILEERLNLDLLVPGPETVVAVADQGCLPNGSSELWTMIGSGHIPFLTFTGFNRYVIEYFYAHPKE